MRYSCTVYIVVVVCNVSSLYKSQERRLSHCCSTALQPATSCVKYIIIFGQIIYIFSRRGLGPTSFCADSVFKVDRPWRWSWWFVDLWGRSMFSCCTDVHSSFQSRVWFDQVVLTMWWSLVSLEVLHTKIYYLNSVCWRIAGAASLQTVGLKSSLVCLGRIPMTRMAL